MYVNFLFMAKNKPHKQMIALEKGLRSKGITREEFYKLITVSKQTYQHWKIRGISARMLGKISKKLGCDRDDLEEGIFTTVDKQTKSKTQGTGKARVMIDITDMTPSNQRRIQEIVHAFNDDTDFKDISNGPSP